MQTKGFYKLDKASLIADKETFDTLSNKDKMLLFSDFRVADNKDMAIYNLYEIDSISCYVLLIVSKKDNSTYDIFPVGYEDNNFDIITGKHVIDLYREDFEDDIVIGVNNDNIIDAFEWTFVAEQDEDLEAMYEYLETYDYESFKEKHDELKEIQIYNEGFNKIDNDYDDSIS